MLVEGMNPMVHSQILPSPWQSPAYVTVVPTRSVGLSYSYLQDSCSRNDPEDELETMP